MSRLTSILTNPIDHDNCCPECGTDDIVADMARGDLICSCCGLILASNTIDNRAEWRAFSIEEYDKKSNNIKKWSECWEKLSKTMTSYPASISKIQV